MKKNRILFLLGLLLMVSFSFTACGGDDEDDNVASGIVGEWASQDEASDGSWMYLERIKFEKNGTFTVVFYSIYLSNGSTITGIEKGGFSGSYKADNGQLSLTYEGKTGNGTYSISGNQLTVVNNGDMITYDKMDSNISEIFDKAERAYQNQ